MEIKVGIAYEGGLDTAYLSTLVQRLLAEKGYTNCTFTMVKPGTAIVKFVPAYVLDFKSKGVELNIFITDLDKDEDRRGQIRDAIRKVDAGQLDFSAVGVPNPHVEHWILSDANTVKSVFNLNGSSALPFNNLRPKQQLMSIYKEATFEGSLEDAKIQIAQNCDLDFMSANVNEFNLFRQDINNALNFIQSQPSS